MGLSPALQTESPPVHSAWKSLELPDRGNALDVLDTDYRSLARSRDEVFSRYMRQSSNSDCDPDTGAWKLQDQATVIVDQRASLMTAKPRLILYGTRSMAVEQYASSICTGLQAFGRRAYAYRCPP